MNTQKNLIIGVVVILAILAIIFIIVRHKTPSVPIEPTSSEEKSANGTSGSNSLSRADALTKYGSRVIAITDDCSPSSFTYSFNLEKGTVVMIDNDADTPNTIVLPNKTVTLSPRHYTLETLNVTGAISSTCDPKTHVTTVVVK